MGTNLSAQLYGMGGIIIKFKHRVKIHYYKNKIIKPLFKRMFYVYLYHKILDEFAYGDKSVRYYMRSVESELRLYHEKYKTPFKPHLVREAFLFTEAYIRYKISIYDDVEFVYGESEDGLYFEVSLK